MKDKTNTTFLNRRAAITGLGAAFLLGHVRPLQAAAAQISVVATTGMIADVVRQVGGDLVSVKALMGPGVDPHAYRQTRSDIVAMTRADIVLWHGLYLEAQMERFFEDLSRKGRVVPIAEGVSQDLLVSHADYEGRYDPHIWMDPILWRDVVVAIRDELSVFHPEHAAQFKTNADTFLMELDALADYAVASLAKIPRDKRVLLTAHDAFSYFGRAYDFEVIGIQGISTESEAGLNRISELVDLLVTRDIGAVFVETSVSDRNMRALIEGAAAQGHAVSIGGSLYSDAMGQDGTYEGTYLGMIDHNVTTIARALGADVPQSGRLGRLGLES
ncbi:metal ABC transporter solute-binding protein, Zn/Mn family [Roseobacter fucihabitans]|nr:zinc ABC transporter substrate-binding protein [Roseobacter litoralis]